MIKTNEDYTGKFGALDSGADWEMYSFTRPAYSFWNGVANGLRNKGYSEAKIGEWLGSKESRWLLDNLSQELEILGERLIGEWK